MVKQSLSYYLDILLKEHPEQVFRYREEVQKDYFLTSLVMEMDKRRNSRVVILENIKGSKIPVVGNLFSSRKRIAAMLGCNIDSFSKKWMKADNNLLDPIIVKNGPVIINNHIFSGFRKELLVSICDETHTYRSKNEIISWYTDQKVKYSIATEKIPLSELRDWQITDNEIVNSDRFFTVIGVKVNAESREVTAWTQPLIRDKNIGC